MTQQTETMTKNLTDIWAKRPLIISGPCSAESEEQVLTTARALASTGKVDVLRAGIWKPRTKPGMFEGIGVKGLPWLVKAAPSPSRRSPVPVNAMMAGSGTTDCVVSP